MNFTSSSMGHLVVGISPHSNNIDIFVRDLEHLPITPAARSCSPTHHHWYDRTVPQSKTHGGGGRSASQGLWYDDIVSQSHTHYIGGGTASLEFAWGRHDMYHANRWLYEV